MVYNGQQIKMKKIVIATCFVIGMCFAANAQQSSLEKTDEQNNYFAELTADNCSFEVISAEPSISGTKVTIRVYVEAAFTPLESGDYTVVIKPQGQLRNILDSQQKSLEFHYHKSSGWSYRKLYVDFYCSVDDNTYNQCNSSSFIVSKCYKK